MVGDLPLSRVLLMNDARFPWLILVPRRPLLREIFDLSPDDYRIMMDELRVVAAHFSRMTEADKMNIAALGNMVPQLHFHVIARFEGDAAWPGPVWNAGAGQPYPDATAAELSASLKDALNLA